VIKPEVPASLLSCAPAPKYPGNDMTQRDIAANYTKLWFAHKDCKSKLKSINHALGNSAQAIEK